MFNLIYRSYSKQNITVNEIQKILNSAHIFNSQHNITGCLIYFNNYFIQFLEGDKEQVENLFYNKIMKDKRHQKIELLLSENTTHEKRLFQNWKMAYYHVKQENASEFEKTLFADNLTYFFKSIKKSLMGHVILSNMNSNNRQGKSAYEDYQNMRPINLFEIICKKILKK